MLHNKSETVISLNKRDKYKIKDNPGCKQIIDTKKSPHNLVEKKNLHTNREAAWLRLCAIKKRTQNSLGWHAYQLTGFYFDIDCI